MAISPNKSVSTTILVVVMMSMVARVQAATQECKYVAGKVTPCTHDVKAKDEVKITCAGVSSVPADAFSSATANVCKSKIGGDYQCAATAALNTLVKDIAVKKEGDVITVTAPDKIESDASAYAACGKTKDDQLNIALSFKKSDARSLFMSFVPSALIGVLATVLVVSH